MSSFGGSENENICVSPSLHNYICICGSGPKQWKHCIFGSQVQIAQENYNTIFPTESYDSYVAFETGNVSESVFSNRNRVKEARKDETFFFNAQDAGNFDYIINQIVTEPVIQFSLYLQIRCLFDK
jgi:hypothetical protein